MNPAARLHPELTAPRVESAREHFRNALQVLRDANDETAAILKAEATTRRPALLLQLRELAAVLAAVDARMVAGLGQIEDGNV